MTSNEDEMKFLVIHGCIGGRVINNRAVTVEECFIQGVRECGLPSRVRGGERW